MDKQSSHLEIDDFKGRGRPCKTWNVAVAVDLKARNIDGHNANNRPVWQKAPKGSYEKFDRHKCSEEDKKLVSNTMSSSCWENHNVKNVLTQTQLVRRRTIGEIHNSINTNILSKDWNHFFWFKKELTWTSRHWPCTLLFEIFLPLPLSTLLPPTVRICLRAFELNIFCKKNDIGNDPFWLCLIILLHPVGFCTGEVFNSAGRNILSKDWNQFFSFKKWLAWKSYLEKKGHKRLNGGEIL